LSPRPRAAVSSEEVARLASLSRLALTRQEEAKLKDELSTILGYFKTVEAARGTDEVAARALEPGQLRPDEPRTFDAEEVLRGVPRRKGRLVKAPRVF
jgi:aspartyl/glutamyl-tRNA(Asn/Gln) amidotransferase C subunit